MEQLAMRKEQSAMQKAANAAIADTSYGFQNTY
jgi:hypothetical protein